MKDDDHVTLREFYDRQLVLIGIGVAALVLEVMRRLHELNGHASTIRQNQERSVTRDLFDEIRESDTLAREKAVEEVAGRIRPLEDFRSRAYGMAVILAIAAAALGAFIVKALG